MVLIRVFLFGLLALVLLAAWSQGTIASSGVTTRVSVDSSGNQANDHSCGGSALGPSVALTPCLAVNGDGRFVVFDSNASNLVAGDTNNTRDVFLHESRERGFFGHGG